MGTLNMSVGLIGGSYTLIWPGFLNPERVLREKDETENERGRDFSKYLNIYCCCRRCWRRRSPSEWTSTPASLGCLVVNYSCIRKKKEERRQKRRRDIPIRNSILNNVTPLFVGINIVVVVMSRMAVRR